MRKILIIILLLTTGKSFSQNTNNSAIKKPEISVLLEHYSYIHANGGVSSGFFDVLYVDKKKIGYLYVGGRYKSNLLMPHIKDCDSAVAIHNKAINEFKAFRKKSIKIQAIVIPTIVTGVALGVLVGIKRDQPAYFPIFGFGFAIPALAIARKPILKNVEKYKNGKQLVTKAIDIYNRKCRS